MYTREGRKVLRDQAKRLAEARRHRYVFGETAIYNGPQRRPMARRTIKQRIKQLAQEGAIWTALFLVFVTLPTFLV